MFVILRFWFNLTSECYHFNLNLRLVYFVSDMQISKPILACSERALECSKSYLSELAGNVCYFKSKQAQYYP